MVPRQGDAGDRLQSADTRNTGRARLGRIPRGQAPPLPREAVRCAHALAGAVGLGRVVRTVPARQFSAAFPIFLSHHPLPETRGAQPVLGRRGELPRNLIDLCKDATIMKHLGEGTRSPANTPFLLSVTTTNFSIDQWVLSAIMTMVLLEW